MWCIYLYAIFDEKKKELLLRTFISKHSRLSSIPVNWSFTYDDALLSCQQTSVSYHFSVLHSSFHFPKKGDGNKRLLKWESKLRTWRVLLLFSFVMCLSKTCRSLLSFPDVKDNREEVVGEFVMSFADSSCLV